jgi:hypothetical protein
VRETFPDAEVIVEELTYSNGEPVVRVVARPDGTET